MQTFSFNQLAKIVPYRDSEGLLMTLSEAKNNKKAVIQVSILKLLNNHEFYEAAKKTETNSNSNSKTKTKTKTKFLDEFVEWVTGPKNDMGFLKRKFKWTDEETIAMLTILGSNDLFETDLIDRNEKLEHLIQWSMGILKPSVGSKKMKLLELDKTGLKRSIAEISIEDYNTIAGVVDIMNCRCEKWTTKLKYSSGLNTSDYCNIWSSMRELDHFNFPKTNKIPLINISWNINQSELKNMISDAIMPVMPGTGVIAKNLEEGISDQLKDLLSAVQSAQSLKNQYDDATLSSAMDIQKKIKLSLINIKDVVDLLNKINKKTAGEK
ncbi:hypothetical protein [Levilactobacillus brevis]|uniref:hypothetical protein n=1 Tax=Levilactobacillus brevis TaxID=1580 RepID=UPI0022E2E568|nr:hypothetical protein [Levilactobacillus brevis]